MRQKKLTYNCVITYSCTFNKYHKKAIMQQIVTIILEFNETKIPTNIYENNNSYKLIIIK